MENTSHLKVLVMTNEYQPKIIGGLGIVATQLARALSRIGVDVTVLCSGYSDRLTLSSPHENLRIFRFPKDARYFTHNKQAYKSDPVLQAAIRKGLTKPDLIHVHSAEFADTAKSAADRFHVPIVYSCHSMTALGISSPAGKNQTKLIRFANQIIVPSKWQIHATKRRYPKANLKKFTVIPNGVMQRSNQSIGAPNQLLYVGRLIPSKGIESLIRAIGLLSRNHKQVRLTVVGSGTTNYQRKLRALTKRVGVGKRIRWIKKAPYDAVQRMYASYGAVIVPSKNESFCLVALEAMANGVPLISTLSGGLKEFVNDKNAQIIPAVNSINIAQAIKAFWNNPSQSKNKLIHAHSTATRYSWPAIAHQYRSFFTNLVEVEQP